MLGRSSVLEDVVLAVRSCLKSNGTGSPNSRAENLEETDVSGALSSSPDHVAPIPIPRRSFPSPLRTRFRPGRRLEALCVRQ